MGVMTGRLSTVIALVIVAAVSAAVGYVVATRKMSSATGSVTLEHVALVSNAVTAGELGDQSRKDLRLDVLTSLALVVHLRPDVLQLNAQALNGLCFLRAIVLSDVLSLNPTERKVAELYRPYLDSVSTQVSERTRRMKSTTPRWCADAQQAVHSSRRP